MSLGQTTSTCHLSHDMNRPPHEALAFHKQQPVIVLKRENIIKVKYKCFEVSVIFNVEGLILSLTARF